MMIAPGVSTAAQRTSTSLTITAQRWTGWSKQQPSARTSTIPVKPGTRVPLDMAGGIVLTIGSENGGALTITVENVARINAGGGTNLRSCGQQRYALRRGEQARFATCTLDGGTKWTVGQPR